MKYVASITLLLTLAACAQTTTESETIEESPTPARGEPIPPAEIHAGDYQITGPFAHENLSVFLIQKDHAPQGDLNCLILEEALKAGTLRVAEKSGGAEVNKLEVENTGERPVYLQAGDTVKGGQQDRTIGVDFILRPKSGKTTIDAFCVEPGRWETRGATLSTAATFTLSEAPLASKEQKLAVRLTKSQSQVWTAGGRINGLVQSEPQVSTLSASYVLTIEDPEVRKKVAQYVNTLLDVVKSRSDLVGMAFAVNGEPDTIEIYAASGLFLKLWPKLLRSAAIEALTRKAPTESVKSSQVSDIASLLDESGKVEGRTETLPGSIRVKVYDGKTSALFDTEKDGELLHRQVIKK